MLIAFLLASLSSCTNTTDDCPYCLVPDNIKTRAMLFDGNEWTYRVEQWNEDGSLFSIDTLHRIFRGHKNEFAANDTLEISDNGDTSGSTLTFVSGTEYGEEVYVINNAHAPNPDVVLFMRDLNSVKPYTLHDSTYIQAGDTLIDRTVLTQLSYDTTITVAAGTFHCWHLKRDQYGGNYKNPERQYTIDLFLGRFAGLVLQIDSAQNTSGSSMHQYIKRDLISYHLK
jgi:hypothetical protein